MSTDLAPEATTTQVASPVPEQVAVQQAEACGQQTCSCSLGIDYCYAFQPIVDVIERKIVSYEALIRGPKGEPAFSVLRAVNPDDLPFFDIYSRIAAIRSAAALHVPCELNLNFNPGNIEQSRLAIDRTIDAAESHHFPLRRLVIELTESEVIDDHKRFAELINAYRARGLKVAIDDFGAGYSGLNLLAEFQPDQIKLDMGLVRHIESNGPRQAIVRAVACACTDLGIDIVAEGVETFDEYEWLESEGIRLFQGYLFAKPGVMVLPDVSYPE